MLRDTHVSFRYSPTRPGDVGGCVFRLFFFLLGAKPDNQSSTHGSLSGFDPFSAAAPEE